jgi:histone deacetylase 1/2
MSVTNANGSVSNVEGTGTVALYLTDSRGHKRKVTFSNCLYLPDRPVNLISISKLERAGASVKFGARNFIQDRGTQFPFQREGDLYVLRASPAEVNFYCESASNWHERMGHNNLSDLTRLQQSVNGMAFKNSGMGHCDVCSEAKAHKQNICRQPVPRASKKFELIYSDVAGPIQTPSLDGMRYAISFIDSHSRFARVYFMRTKDEALLKFRKFCADEGQPIAMRTDNGGEYVNKAFEDLCLDRGIKLELTTPYNPQQNGTAERRWRTTFEMARCLLRTAGLPNEFWVRAVDTAFYITNRCLTSSLPAGKTPFELWTGKKPDLSRMKTFGCSAFRYIEVSHGKLNNKATKEVFIGYTPISGTYILYNPETQNVNVSRNVTFNESEFLFSRSSTQSKPTLSEPDLLDFDSEDPEAKIGRSAILASPQANVGNEEEPEVSIVETVSTDSASTSADVTTRSGRVIRQPQWLNQYVTGEEFESSCLAICDDTPSSYKDAMASTCKDEWSKAIQVEYDALMKNGTWRLEQLPQGKRSIGSRWVFRVKRFADGTIEKYKARLVAKGFAQQPGSDYFETFAPTAKLTTLRACFALAAQSESKIFQLDVKSAYLNAEMNEDVYMDQPEGYVKEPNKHLVCKLVKCLYGLKQAGREWNAKLCKWFVDHNFTQSTNDPCLFTRGALIVVIWVDDILYFAPTSSLSATFLSEFKETFAIDDKGEMVWFLGNQIEQRPGTIRLHQGKFIEDILTKSGMSNCAKTSLPAVAGTRQSKQDCPKPDSPEAKEMEIYHPTYRTIVGSLLYLSVMSRPDITFTVCNLSQFVTNPGMSHWRALKHLLRYLKGTQTKAMTFKRVSSASFYLRGFSDSDWASDSDDRRSMSGYCFALTDNGPLVSWQARKQGCIALSSCEAEYVALSQAAQEMVFLSGLINDIGIEVREIPTLFCDNQGSVALASNSMCNKRSKHIDIRHHFIRDQVKSSKVKVTYVSTRENWADLFTKNLSNPRFAELSLVLMGE